jgi:hypothetical protein
MTLLTDAASPLLTILYQVTWNRAGAVCLLVIPVVRMAVKLLLRIGTTALIVRHDAALLTTVPRMTWAFVRDSEFPFRAF